MSVETKYHVWLLRISPFSSVAKSVLYAVSFGRLLTSSCDVNLLIIVKATIINVRWRPKFNINRENLNVS
jgi:hypothetical protein